MNRRNFLLAGLPLASTIGSLSLPIRHKIRESQDPMVQQKLIAASANDDIDSVKQFLKAGADLDGLTLTSMIDGPTWQSALHVAVANRNVAMCSFLLKSGANPNVLSKGSTELPPLFLAPRLEILKLLIEFGADQNERGEVRESILVHYTEKHLFPEFKYLLPNCDPNIRDASGLSVLEFCIYHNATDQIEELVRRGAIVGNVEMTAARIRMERNRISNRITANDRLLEQKNFEVLSQIAVTHGARIGI